MDLEFHYYVTYLIASRAGCSPDEAVIIAHAVRQACTWRSPDGFEASHWYQFQEAIKAHFDECQKILLQEGLDVGSHSR